MPDFDVPGASLAAAAASLRLFDRRAASRAFEPFDALELAVVQALVRAVCAPDAPAAAAPAAPPPGLPAPDVSTVARRVEEAVMRMPLPRATDLRNLLVLLEYQPRLRGPRRARFSDLTPEEARQNLQTFQTAPAAQRLAVEGLRRLCQLHWWCEPATWAAIGYDGPWTEIQERGNAIAEVAE